MTWHPDTEPLILSKNYEPVLQFYEQLAQREADTATHGWYLGLAYLLNGQEETAQTIWLFYLAQGSDAAVENWQNELLIVLWAEANRQAQAGCPETALLIRHHIRNIDPQSLDNLLNLVILSIAQEQFVPENLESWQVTTQLQNASINSLESSLVYQSLTQVLEFPSQLSLDFATACRKHVADVETFFNLVLVVAHKIAYQTRKLYYAIALANLCYQINPSHPETLKRLSRYHMELGDYLQAVEFARKNCSLNQSPIENTLAHGRLLSALMSAGSWQDIPQVAEQQVKLLTQALQDKTLVFSTHQIWEVLIGCNLLFYLKDSYRDNRRVLNQVAQKLQWSADSQKAKAFEFPLSQRKDKNRRLKIGYIGHTFRAHSVGWLCRWLFQYHNRESFEVGIYFVNQNQVNHNLDNPIFQSWFQPNIDFARCLGVEPDAIAQQIQNDQIDILVDLDSITLDVTCHVMALKPAPIQVSWLGFDATGLPAVDYFIADPYVLPANAQDYYTEKIWRLPHTYLGVDGFEVGIPTLHREQLEIPADSVIYLSSQSGMKRHPDTVRLQMQILKAVPNSYFLIKGKSDQNSIQQFFNRIAEEEGVDPQRLRFLPRDENEFIHRANLRIADIILDTYPYNGATTTLETLWMGIPLVTRVGEQFAARNSYTFMMNVGVKEGIAWSDQEYVEWGYRFGTDQQLRQKVAWKLKKSRQTSPLWDAKNFTRELENAYRTMWADYLCPQL